MFDADQIIFDAAWETLPTKTLDQRREILMALRCKITARHPAFKNVEAQLAAIDAIDSLQSQLPFRTNGGAK